MIVARRQELGWTQAELAKKTGISRSYLAVMETGRTRIYLHHLLKLEKTLEFPLLGFRFASSKKGEPDAKI